MADRRAEHSLRRRILFSGNTRILFDRLTEAALKTRLPIPPAIAGQRGMIVKAASACFDIVECLRTGRRVPSIGEPEKAAAAGTVGRAPQHPRQLTYWYDADRHVLAGLSPGIDVIKRADKFYVIENNLGAALRPERRRLYDTPFDPIVMGLVTAAREAGFRTLVPYAHRWSEFYIREFRQAGEDLGVDVRPACAPGVRSDGSRPLAGLPNPLPESTMYSFFDSRNTAIDHFVHSKTISAEWLRHGLSMRDDRDSLLDLVRTENRLFVPPVDDDRWPNLAVKLDGWDKGEFVAVGRFETEAQAREALGLRRDTDRPRVFDLGIGRRLSARLLDKGNPVYQEFIAPDCDADGRPIKFRVHAFLSPLFDRFLSAHAMVAPGAPTEKMQPGEVRRDGTLVLSFSKGAKYTALMPGLEPRLETVTGEFARILNAAITERFETGP